MTPTQELVIESVARTTSAISLAGCLFILLTFALFPAFRKPINRLIVYASIGNILTNSATVVSVAAIPRHGASLALCRFQGFFIQMFMPADSLWTLCMALNVYLTFFKNFNAVDLRGLEMRYFALCYGICFIPALVYLCLDLSRLNTGIYSDAVLWCWVGKDWEWMRIAFFYGPVWVVIIITIGIYCYTGRVIFKQRKALRAFSRSNEQPFPPVKNPFNATNAVTATTEVVVTSESIESAGNTKRGDPEADSRSSFSSTPVPAELLLDFEGPRPSSSGAGNRKPSTAGRHANDAAWGYAKVAFLMFVALFIVWVPSTVNRVYALAKPNETNFALSVVAAFVLPMQGFWNFSIYVSTSWSQCKDAWKETWR
ncbi:putative g-protein coupled receptor protein [Neofusicoccum parvum UCRNP2]|uniref:Putative g-protein coupled receptor protein n=1 Tax=Botryosphaeria parva (strain UCR-NP2) TaxID=1287680 RepID=R1H1Y6_BOTPV|nr:putative g-protein coupled receptor protein [Neofusicoccum parvum UCRNP2]